MHFKKVTTHRCKVVKPGMIGVGMGSLGSILSTFMNVFIGCCSAPTAMLVIPIVGGILVSALGTVLSVASFIGMILASIHLANKLVS